jgi:hypothetical protein
MPGAKEIEFVSAKDNLSQERFSDPYFFLSGMACGEQRQLLLRLRNKKPVFDGLMMMKHYADSILVSPGGHYILLNSVYFQPFLTGLRIYWAYFYPMLNFLPLFA